MDLAKLLIDGGVSIFAIAALIYVLLTLIKHNEEWLKTITALKDTIETSAKDSKCNFKK